MNAPQSKAKSLFLNAVELHAPAQRQAYLDAECGSDAALRREVEELLRHFGQVGSFLEPVPADPALTVDAPPVREGPGTVIGPYKLVEEIGEGGMGTVWMAQQTEPVKRLVALKVIKAGMDSKQILARFEAERQALALMDHPHIAKVHDGGTTADGRPYFIMELVKGVPLTKYCDEHRLTPRQRLELFIPVCQAIQHAHQKGIIHRDVKPSNVLVAPYDGKPVVKVIDFGIAKATGPQLTDKTLVTGFGAVVGTLEYMSPEQAELNNQDIDTRSDVYALGVLLYELLTGRTPLDRARLKETGLLEALRRVREEEPLRPSTRLSEAKETLPSISAQRGTEPAKLTKIVRGELDWIVMKALEKDRNRRYETANGFAQDVQRYLADEPVLACPPSALYRVRKFARRHKARLAAAVLVLAVLLVSGGGLGWVAFDRAARRLAVGREVDQALAEARAFCQRDRLVEAAEAVKRAEKLLASAGGGTESADRVVRARTDLAMVARLEVIRLQQPRREKEAAAAGRDRGYRNALGEAADAAGREGLYRDAFREYGLDVMALDPDAAAERIKASAIREQLLAALYDWLGVKRVGLDLWVRRGDPGVDQHLLAVLGRADESPWRSRFRDAWGRKDRKALEEMARDPAALDQPPATVLLFARLLPRALTLEVLRSAQRRHPDDFWFNFALAQDLDWTSPARPVEALGYYRAALAIRPDFTLLHVFIGNELRRQGDLTGAAAEYRQGIALPPDDPDFHYNLGNACGQQDDFHGAAAAFRQALALRPGHAETHNKLGFVLRASGKPADAAAAFRQAIALRPGHAEAHRNLGEALRDLRDLAGAAAAFRQALILEPDNFWYHFDLGNTLDRQGDFAGAGAEFHKCVVLQPDSPLAHYNLGNGLMKQGKLGEAIACYHKAITLEPNDAKPHNNLGVALYEQGKMDEAIACYRKAIALDPKFAAPHANLGIALSKQGKWDEALAAFRRAIVLDPKNADTHNYLGVALYKQGKVGEALAAFRRAIERNPKRVNSWMNRGNAHRNLGQYDKALADYETVLKLTPTHAGIHNELAWLLATCPDAKLRDPKRAVELASKAVHLAPKEANHWNTLGAAHYRAGDWKAAIAALDRSRDLKKAGDAVDWLFLAMARRKLGNVGEARRAYEQALRWLEKNSELLSKDRAQAAELRRFRSEAEAVLALKKQ